MDDFDDRNMFFGGGMWKQLVDKTKTRWAILEPLKEPTHDILNTLRVLCGNWEIVAFHTEQPSEVKAEVMYTCRFFVEYDGITNNPYNPRYNNKLCLSLRAVFFGADLPDGRQIRHVYPEAKGDSNEPLGPVFIAMVVHRYSDTRHRLVLAPSGGLSAVNFWRKLVKELKRIFDDADCEVRDLTVLGLPHATDYILDEEQDCEQVTSALDTATGVAVPEGGQKTGEPLLSPAEQDWLVIILQSEYEHHRSAKNFHRFCTDYELTQSNYESYKAKFNKMTGINLKQWFTESRPEDADQRFQNALNRRKYG